MNILGEIKPSIVEKMIDDNIVMIDVRREDEWIRTGLIKNAYKMTFFDEYGNHDVKGWMQEFEKIVKSKDETFILICAHANRTRSIGNFLIDQGYKNTAHLTGGMAAWLMECRETIKH